ncbi:phosphate propanoyltransferase [Calderihabitans maritimus]|uniref:Phosphate propanoyltransferase n=1 Tax=Calderihabitans maritimus TaxID=1246530 RepID=A0A1Z5HST9_9FIRM|nr:phosphate propanoyltransferase [Calderihabitans maritimus]GAW92596.1 propanediol utilization protein [Calderihabitans maritimus]
MVEVERFGEPTNELWEYLEIEIPVGVSNRHVHLSQQDLEMLFGHGHRLKARRELGQPGEFAAEEVVTLVGPRGVIEGVRIVGPLRDKTQVEISMTDAYRLGLRPPVRKSGDLEGTPGIAVVGPKGVVALGEGVILAARHIHMHTREAEKLGLKNDDRVRVRVAGERAQIMENVIIRVSDKYRLEMHVDTDEANAALLTNGDTVTILH